MKLKTLLLFTTLTLMFTSAYSQIGIGNDIPNKASILDIKDTNRGVLLPRIEGDGILDSIPPDGLLYYNTNEHGFRYYDSKKWQCLNPWKEMNTDTITTPYKVTVVDFNSSTINVNNLTIDTFLTVGAVDNPVTTTLWGILNAQITNVTKFTATDTVNLGENAIQSSEIDDGTIDSMDIKNNSITREKIANNWITNDISKVMRYLLNLNKYALLQDTLDNGATVSNLVNLGYSLKFILSFNNYKILKDTLMNKAKINDLINMGFTKAEIINTRLNTQSFIDASITINGLKGEWLDQDSNTFKYVGIGNQIWMAENLKVTKYSNGTPMRTTSLDNWKTSTPPDEYYYPNDYYTLQAAIGYYSFEETEKPLKYQGACPSGWHIPSISEFTNLNHALLPELNAIQYGYISSDGKFLEVEETALWWTSFSELPYDGACIYLQNQTNVFDIKSFPINTGANIRCVLD